MYEIIKEEGMKRQSRKGVFETNSSSMHAVAIMKEDELDTLEVDKTINKVRTKFGKYGFGVSIHTDAKTKLSYLVTMLVEIYHSCCSVEELYQLEDFKQINEAVAAHCHCDGVLIDEIVTKSRWSDDDWVCNNHEGWIDHGTYEEYDSVAEFLEEVRCTAEEFIFHKKVKLVIKDDSFFYHDKEATAIYGEWMKSWIEDDREDACNTESCDTCRRCWGDTAQETLAESDVEEENEDAGNQE